MRQANIWLHKLHQTENARKTLEKALEEEPSFVAAKRLLVEISFADGEWVEAQKLLDQLAAEYIGRLKIAKLNVDENPVTASQFGIQSIPTMLIFNKGRQVNKIMGAVPKQEIERELVSVL